MTITQILTDYDAENHNQTKQLHSFQFYRFLIL